MSESDDWSDPESELGDSVEYDPARDGIRQITERMLRLERLVAGALRGSPLRQAGIAAETDLIRVLGSLVVEKELAVTGDTRILGTLSLPAGIIDNDALANPLQPAHGYASADGFGLTTSSTDVAVATVTVPEGFTKCWATGLGSIFVLNPTPNVDYLYTRIYIDSATHSWWGARPLSMIGPNNGSAALAPSRSTIVDGLEGGQTLTFRLTAFTNFAAMSSASNFGTIDAGCVFFR